VGRAVLISMRGSIREFCEVDTPIFMFDKNGFFQVMKLEQVCLDWNLK
jgi:hypothetical protein